MIRVAQVITGVDAQSGGTSVGFLNTVAALGTQRGRLTVTAYASEPPPGDPAWARIKKDEDGGTARWRLGASFGRYLVCGPVGRAVAADIGAGEVDIVHIHGLWSPDLVAAAAAADRAGIPFFFQPHGMLNRTALGYKRLKKQAFLRVGLGRLLRRASGFIFVTRDERDTSVLPPGTPPERVHIVPLPVEMPDDRWRLPGVAAEGRARFGIPDVPVVLFMGRLHPVKRLELTFRALAAASRTRPDVRLLLLGAGDEDYTASLRRLAETLGIAPRVIFAGWVDGDDKHRALAAADVLVLNSMFENFGYVAVEALGMGTPVVLTENLALAAEVRAAGAGTVAAPDPEGLGAALVEAIGRPDRAALAERGRAWVARTFSTAAIGASLLGIYSAAHAGAPMGAGRAHHPA